MFDIDLWLAEITKKIKDTFKEDVLFVGYQGSYRRGEATEQSDIDMVVVLRELDIEKTEQYRNIVESMSFSQKACGFLSSKKVLQSWSKNELFQLYNDTKPLYGDLKALLPLLSRDDAEQAAKIGAQNLYHTAVHSFLYSKDKKIILSDLYKAAFFVLQAQYFYEKGEYILNKKELFERLSEKETGKEILAISLKRELIKDFSPEQTKEAFSLLLEFCQQILTKSL